MPIALFAAGPGWRRRAASMALVARLATAAATAQPAAPAATAPRPSTLPPGLDRVLRDYERAWRAGDVTRLVR